MDRDMGRASGVKAEAEATSARRRAKKRAIVLGYLSKSEEGYEG